GPQAGPTGADDEDGGGDQAVGGGVGAHGHHARDAAGIALMQSSRAFHVDTLWDMRAEHLSAFEAVARLGTFTRAAEEQFVAQPSLSRQIRTLEAELGAALFDRGRRGAELTEAGRVLLPIARRMLADAETARTELDELAGLR